MDVIYMEIQMNPVMKRARAMWMTRKDLIFRESEFWVDLTQTLTEKLSRTGQSTTTKSNFTKKLVYQGGGGTEMPNIGWEGGGPVGLRKKNCDLAQTGAILRQEGSGSMSINSTVVQNVLWSSG